MSHAERRKDGDRIAVGVAGAEVVELNAIRAQEDRHFARVSLIGQELRLLALKLFHLQHARFRVLVGDDFNRCRKEVIAAKHDRHGYEY